jgi:hypothetical protein
VNYIGEAIRTASALLLSYFSIHHLYYRYLPISHPKTKNAMPDCSMKPSVLALDKLPDDYICSGDKYSIGEKVVASVITVS